MRKMYSSLMAVVLLCVSTISHAQMTANYSFSATAGTYTDIAGGTPVSTSMSVADFLGDTRTSITFPIGFSFDFNGLTYTQLRAASDGFITLNTATGTTQATNNLSTASVNLRPLIAPLWDDLDGASGSGAANYITTGAVGSRVFTMEWKNWQWNWNATGATISFQVKLYEGTNVIEFIYRLEAGIVNSGSASIGLAATGIGIGNFISLNNSGTAPAVSSTVETTTISTKPANGQTYRFTPNPCAPPVGLSTTGLTSTSVNLNWSVPTTGNFEVVASTSTTYPSGAGTPIVNGGTVTGLVPGLTNYIYVRQNCGAGSASGYTVISVLAPCVAQPVPYFEGFESITAANVLPTCITATSFGTLTFTNIAPLSFNRSARTGTDYGWFRYGPGAAGQYFFTAPLIVEAGKKYRMSVWYKADGITGFEAIRLNWGTAGTAAAQTNLIAQRLAPNNTAYQELFGIFTATTSGTIFGSIQVTGTSASPEALTIDDISVIEALPVDLMLTSASATTVGCPGNATTISAVITNNGGMPIDFAATPVTLTANLTGAGTSTATATVNTGTLTPGASQTVVFSSGVPLTNGGSYVVTVTGALTGDLDATNNTVSTTTSALVAPTALSITASSNTLCPGDAPAMLTANGGIGIQSTSATSGAISLTIPDNSLTTGIATQLTIAGIPSGTVIDSLAVTLNATHTFVGDLIFNLQGPNGQIINLFNRQGSLGDNLLNTRITSNTTAPALSSGLPPFTGTWRADLASIASTTPATTSTSFASVWGTPNGTYTLRAYDAGSGDVGPLTNWSITLFYQGQKIIWSPPTDLFTDAGLTMPYTAGSNATTVYTSPAMSTSLTYTATASGVNGCNSTASTTVTSALATAIATQPVSTSACAGQGFTFTVSAQGGNLTYQWFKDGVAIPGATSSTYAVALATASDAGNYYVVVSGACAPASVTSSTVNLTFGAGTVISAQPQNASACSGSSATFSVVASGSSLQYQWRKNGVAIAGATGSSFTIASASAADAGSYDVLISSGCSVPIVSSTATFSLLAAPVVTTAPTAQTACTGTAASFSTAATGSGLTYQWFFNGTAIAGATGASYTNPSVTNANAGNYSVTVSGSCAPPVSTAGVALIVSTAPVISTQPSNQSACLGSPATFTVVAATPGSVVTYQWFFNGALIPGATGPSFTVATSAADSVGNFTVEVTNTLCGTKTTSAAASFTLLSAPAITVQPVGSTGACSNANITLSVSATGSGLTYQWFRDGVAIPGATASTYTVVGSTPGVYTVRVNGTCGTVTSTPATITAATSNTWFGSVSSDWNTAANWCLGVPTAAQNITIDSGRVNMPVLSGVGFVNNLTVNRGASVTIATGGTLNLYGNLVTEGTWNASNGTLAIRGSFNQSIPGMNVGTLVMDGAGGATLTGNMNILSNLMLTNGNLTLGAFNVTLPTVTSITANWVGSVASHLITNGLGSVISVVNNLSVIFPVGPDATSYNPVSIAEGEGITYRVRSLPGTSPAIFDPSLGINRSWVILPSRTPSAQPIVSLGYTDAQANGNATPAGPLQVGAFLNNRWVVAVPATGVTISGSSASRIAVFRAPYFGTFTLGNAGAFNAINSQSFVSAMLMPNRITNTATLRVVARSGIRMQWMIVDNAGRMVRRFETNLQAGQTDTQLDVTGLVPGSYLLRGYDASSAHQEVLRFIKL